MQRFYTLLLTLAMPFILLRLLWRSLRAPAYRVRWRERFGLFDARPTPGGVWIHAVSVGETQAIEPLVRHLMEQQPQLPIIITTTTPTGSARVRALFGDSVFHVYFPYDMPCCVRKFLQQIQPKLLLMVETEIWPNLLAICEQQGVKTILTNGRLSERSARGYARLGAFARETFARITELSVQSDQDAARFIQLGVPADRVQVAGSIKFDMKIPASVQEQTQVIRRMWGEARSVWVAASTHEGEEELVLQAHELVKQQIPNALLVIVPRHPERFDRVANMLQRKKIDFVRRSGNLPCAMDIPVFLGDSMGELPLFLGASDVAFIGGSLANIGGHNMLEASAQGVPVTYGPHVFNFSAIAALLQEEAAAVQIHNAQELGELVASWLANASERSRIGENGRQVVEANRGALERLMQLLDGYL